MKGDPASFVQFGDEHFGALVVIAAVAVALALVLRRNAGRASEAAVRLVVCWGLAVLLVVAQLAEQGAAIVGGYWSLQERLPLHLCDIAVVVVVVALVGAARVSASVGRRQQLFYELAWFWGIGGTVQALLTPDLNDPFPQPAYFAYFAEHGGIVVAVLILTVGLGMRPGRGSLWRVWLLTNALTIPIAGINAMFGSNYMFLCGPPENPSLFDYFGRWPWSLITLEVVGTAILVLCYTPFWLSDRVARAPQR